MLQFSILNVCILTFLKDIISHLFRICYNQIVRTKKRFIYINARMICLIFYFSKNISTLTVIYTLIPCKYGDHDMILSWAFYYSKYQSQFLNSIFFFILPRNDHPLNKRKIKLINKGKLKLLYKR